MGRAYRKVVSVKKLSARLRGSFVDKKLLPSVVVDSVDSVKVLSCVFFSNILCSHRKSAKVFIMNRCHECSHFLRFEHEMDVEDERVMDEIDEIRKHGYDAV
jgi:hypothetical protein